MATLTHSSLIAQNRAKFSKNRIVYITPSGMHVSHDVDKEALEELTKQLREAKFTVDATVTGSDENQKYFTNVWVKQGDDDFFESYVITTTS